jgi:hypothetical protein
MDSSIAICSIRSFGIVGELAVKDGDISDVSNSSGIPCQTYWTLLTLVVEHSKIQKVGIQDRDSSAVLAELDSAADQN